MTQDISVIIAAAGKSRRFGDDNFKKPFARLEDRAVWLHSVEKFLNRPDVAQVILVIAREDHEDFMSRFAPNIAILGIDVVHGGSERADSVEKGLAKVASASRFVAIHDAARPCIDDEDIDKVFAAARKSGAAILATPIDATIKEVSSDQKISATVPRSGKWLAQTPQVFEKQKLIDAFAKRGSFQPTDESELVERSGQPVQVVSGSPLNLKITTRRDMKLAAAILKSRPAPKLDGPFHPFADDQLWR
jgi:2-C-methyl-D-erythritol 4-phosphate cytidylyltransferase